VRVCARPRACVIPILRLFLHSFDHPWNHSSTHESIRACIHPSIFHPSNTITNSRNQSLNNCQNRACQGGSDKSGGALQRDRSLLSAVGLRGRQLSSKREERKQWPSAGIGGPGEVHHFSCSKPPCLPTAATGNDNVTPPVTPAGIHHLELAGNREQFNAWVGTNKVPVKWSRRPGPKGIVSVVISTLEGPFIVLHEGKVY
jgi:hypothetical protein